MSDCAEVHAGLVRGNQERPNSMADIWEGWGLGYRVRVVRSYELFLSFWLDRVAVMLNDAFNCRC